MSSQHWVLIPIDEFLMARLCKRAFFPENRGTMNFGCSQYPPTSSLDVDTHG
ncbi:Uncharacterised protein [Vibrio cholerae]|nr:Uncharacterised protein [Vibrio cholerae]